MTDGSDRCAWCDRPELPPVIQPYLFYTRAGKPIHLWLHPGRCRDAAHARYLEKRAEWAAKAGMFDDPPETAETAEAPRGR